MNDTQDEAVKKPVDVEAKPVKKQTKVQLAKQRRLANGASA